MNETGKKTSDEKYCAECGGIIKAISEICPKCGVRQSIGKSKLAAALLALFVGGFGIHKFYLGRAGWGILYLLFCWTFVPAVIGFIEGILLLVMNETDFNRRYCSR